MKRPRTTPSRVLALWAAGMELWFLIQVFELADTWQERGIGLGFGLIFVGVMVLLARQGFRRAVAQPLPLRGANGWLARRPARSAVIVAASLMAIPTGAVLAETGFILHRFPPTYEVAISLSGWFIAALGIGAFWNLVWQRQRKRNPLADVARGAHSGTPEDS